MDTQKTFQLCVLLIMGAVPVKAQEVSDIHPILIEKFTLDAGVFFPERNFKIHVDGLRTGPNPSIDFENEFGLNKSDQVFALEFGWRFGKKWSLLTQYFETSGSRIAVLDEDIEWEDVTFSEGSNATAGQEFAVIRTFFGRRFNTSERHYFGVGAGLHWFELGAFIEGEILVDGQSTQFGRESVSVEAPLPNIGVGINYRIFDKFGAGLSYNWLELDLSITRPDWRGGTETTYQGLFVSASGYS